MAMGRLGSPVMPKLSKTTTPPGLPGREQILRFIEESDQPAGKREIARAFGLKGNEKIRLKALLKDMADEGLIDLGPGRAFHKMGGVPKVTVLRVVDVDGDQVIAVPEHWVAEGTPPPRLRVMERGRRQGALGVGDRIHARTEEAGRGLVAHPLKKLAKGEEQVLGVVHKEGDFPGAGVNDLHGRAKAALPFQRGKGTDRRGGQRGRVDEVRLRHLRPGER